MKLDDLVTESLVEKNRRQRQEKCKHRETYSQGVTTEAGSYSSSFCLDCGKTLSRSVPSQEIHPKE